MDRITAVGFKFSLALREADILWVEGDELIAYVSFSSPPDGISVFEVRRDYRNQGIGAKIIAELKTERPKLWLEGWIESPAAGRFWRRLGLAD